jgi:ribosome biogenesis GTPase
MLNSQATGRVIKGIAGFYTVYSNDGESLEASVRGRIRQDDELYVGDIVRYERASPGRCIIESIVPRTTLIKRPYVANVDQVCLVFALKDPDYNTILMDRFLVLTAASGVETMILLNKADLVTASVANKLAKTYRGIGYPVKITCTIDHRGKRLVSQDLKGKVTVFAGPSGVGKTALINMLCPGHDLKTGAISTKISRGRHTTRQVELLPLKEGGFIADSPGFTQIDLDFFEPNNLKDFFPEFQELGPCRFRGCLHLKEPGCMVKAAVEEQKIPRFRYEHYQEFYEEVLGFYQQRYR